MGTLYKASIGAALAVLAIIVFSAIVVLNTEIALLFTTDIAVAKLIVLMMFIAEVGAILGAAS